MSQPTLALIGAGNWGKNLARNFHALGSLHTICESNQQLLESYRPIYPNVNLESSIEKVLQNPAIDRVAIAAPAPLHYALAKQALLAGKDVFVEKPLCLDIKEAEELNSLADQLGRTLMVGHLLQYHPCVIHLQKMIRHGDLGRVFTISSHRLNLGTIRTEENALWSFAPHDISVILSLAGGKLPKQLRCMGGDFLSKGVADTTLTTLKFDNDILAHIYVSWLHPFKEQKLVVTGSHGMAVFDDTLPWEQKLQFFNRPVTWKEGTIPLANKVAGEFISVPFGEPLKEECLHFLQSCDAKTPPRTDGIEGLRVLKVLTAAQKSLEKNGEAEMLRDEDHAASFFAHVTAEINPKATIGKGSKIWHFSHIMDGAELGENCNIGQNVVISPGVKLGRNVKVQNNVSVYTGVVCEEDVFLGPSMVFTNVINPRSAVNRKNEYKVTTVRKGATIGANATIVCGNELGEHCFVGAGAVVTKSIKPFALVIGNPARQTGWVSAHGEKLELPLQLPEGQAQEAVCSESGERYRLTGNKVEKL